MRLVRDLLVDGVGTQHRLGDHHGRAEDAGAVVEGGAGDADRAGGQGGRAAVDDFADAGEQVFVGVGDVAADDDHAGVEEVHGAGQHAAEFAAGLADEPHGFGASVADVAYDVAAVVGLDAQVGEVGGHGAAAGDRFQTAQVAAAADDVVVVGDVDVADVAGGALGAAVDAAVGDHAAADAGADLDEEQVVGVAPARPVLAERHDVDVVVDQHRRPIALLQVGGDAVAVPAGHDRRRHRRPGDELDRPRHADPDAAHVPALAAGLLQQAVERLLEPGEHDLRALRDRDVLARLGHHVAGQVGHGDTRVRRPEIRRQHDARVAVEGERPWRAPSARRARLGGHHESARQQRVDALGDGRAREPGQLDELRVRARTTVADEPQHRPRAVGRRSCKACHLLSLPERTDAPQISAQRVLTATSEMLSTS